MATAEAPAQPSLKLSSTAPVSVRGAHFEPKERVRVRLRGPGVDAVRRVHTGRRGRFSVAFAGVIAGDRCTGLVVTAVGATGDGASLNRRPRPGCPPA